MADREVWQFARDYGYVIVSKDSDFNDLAFMHGPPPKVVWLRGNATTNDIAAVLTDAADKIATFASNDTDAVLVLTAPHPRRR
jgi:predicted nuclease of predicted toxin-antitoxin system